MLDSGFFYGGPFVKLLTSFACDFDHLITFEVDSELLVVRVLWTVKSLLLGLVATLFLVYRLSFHLSSLLIRIIGALRNLFPTIIQALINSSLIFLGIISVTFGICNLISRTYYAFQYVYTLFLHLAILSNSLHIVLELRITAMLLLVFLLDIHAFLQFDSFFLTITHQLLILCCFV